MLFLWVVKNLKSNFPLLRVMLWLLAADLSQKISSSGHALVKLLFPTLSESCSFSEGGDVGSYSQNRTSCTCLTSRIIPSLVTAFCLCDTFYKYGWGGMLIAVFSMQLKLFSLHTWLHQHGDNVAQNPNSLYLLVHAMLFAHTQECLLAWTQGLGDFLNTSHRQGLV